MILGKSGAIRGITLTVGLCAKWVCCFDLNGSTIQDNYVGIGEGELLRSKHGKELLDHYRIYKDHSTMMSHISCHNCSCSLFCQSTLQGYFGFWKARLSCPTCLFYRVTFSTTAMSSAASKIRLWSADSIARCLHFLSPWQIPVVLLVARWLAN